MRNRKEEVMAWTAQQQKAIDTDGRSLLVSAAAGSGKTAVMVERVCRLVTEEGLDVRQLLVVTFTNAAASEMREKIRSALRKKAKESPKFREQLELLPQAAISTFHSFALDVIRRFFYLTDLEASFSIADEARSTVLREEAMEELLDDRYEEESPAFRKFMDWYSGEKNDDSVRSLLLKLDAMMQSLPDPEGMLKERVSELNPSGDLEDSRIYCALRTASCEELEKAMEDLERACGILEQSGCPDLADKLAQVRAQQKEALQCCASGSLDDAGAYVQAIVWPRLTASKDEKENYAAVKDVVSSLRDASKKRIDKLENEFFSESVEDAFLEIAKTEDVAETLTELLEDFQKRYHEKKQQNRMIDFNDIEHYCLQILQDEKAAEYYRSRFRAVFIDEYQDTSLVQEAIISRIARPDNLFMVGDQKQCIYQFRLAEPRIFRDKYQAFKEEMQRPDGQAMKIDLNRNFRSKPVILQAVNDVFRPVMPGYDDDAALYPGIPYDGEYSFPPETRIIDLNPPEGLDSEIVSLKKADLEAREAARLIRENVGKPYYDSKSGQVKTLQYKDIVILQRSVLSSSGAYIETMQEENIPLYMDSNDGFFDRAEIHVFMNLLAVIDNLYQDVPMISVLRSEIFRFSTDELAEIRSLSAEGTFTEALMAAAETGPDPLAGKCADVLQKIRGWKLLSLAMPLPDFLWKLMLDTGYYVLSGAMPDGEMRQANLRVLLARAQQYSEGAQSSLYAFMQYIDAVRRHTVKTGQAKLLSENDNVVRMMTIHKSKGLEFPMVIIAGMGNALNYTSGKDPILFHKDIGLGMSLEDPENRLKKNTLTRSLIVHRYRQEEYEENIRILYVAMTRAREKLYLLGSVKDAQQFLENKEAGIRSGRSFLDMMETLPRPSVITMDQLDAAGTAEERQPLSELPEAGTKGEYDKIISRLNYRYPHSYAQSIRSKYTVTSLNEQQGKSEEQDHRPPEAALHVTKKVPLFMQEKKGLTFAERGTVYHGIMEHLDFARAESGGPEFIRQSVSEMLDAGILLPEEADAVDLQKIAAFFDTGLGKRCARAAAGGRLWKEQTFNLVLDLQGESSMVQGIIDCFFREGDHIVLLDYKSNWVDFRKPFEEEQDRLLKKYRTQLRIYREAVQKGMKLPVSEAYLYLFSAGRCIALDDGDGQKTARQDGSMV